jgi:hypothetical protein
MAHSPRSQCRRVGRALVICSVFHTSVVLAQTPGIKILVVEGQGAINNIQQKRAKEPVVQVTEDNEPVAGATVTFLLPDTGASGFFGTTNRMLTIQTDAKGQATGHGLRPNSTPGRFQIRVTASYHGETATAMIAQINAQPAGATKGGGGGKKFLIIALIGGAAAGGLVAAKGSKSGGSTVSNPSSPPGTVLVPGTPVLQPPH